MMENQRDEHRVHLIVYHLIRRDFWAKVTRKPTSPRSERCMACGGTAFVSYGLERDTLARSLRAALVIGTLLGLINHGPALVSGHLTGSDLGSFLITYLVPFAVTTYGQVQGKRQRDRLRGEQSQKR